MTTVRLSQINIGTRIRKEFGDVEALARSIEEHGLLHPVVVLDDYTLVAGGRRLKAVELLGWPEVPVTVVNVLDLLAAERDENAMRKDLTPSEAVELGRIIEAEHRSRIAAAVPEQRKRAGYIRSKRPEEDLPDAPALGRTHDVVAAAVGLSGPTYQRAKAVVDAAEAEPEKYADLAAQMDETGKVTPAHDELKRRRAEVSGRSAVHYRTPHPKPNREMERGLTALDGLVHGFGLIELNKLDRERTQAWAAHLSIATASLSRLARKVRGLYAEG